MVIENTDIGSTDKASFSLTVTDCTEGVVTSSQVADGLRSLAGGMSATLLVRVKCVRVLSRTTLTLTLTVTLT